jgi:hypothetical protein
MEAIFDALSPIQREILLNGPALAPPPGVIPNFTDPPSRKDLCVGLAIANISIAALVVGIRLYTKVFCVKKLRLEDCMSSANTSCCRYLC